jgi:hypothetical protein
MRGFRKAASATAVAIGMLAFGLSQTTQAEAAGCSSGFCFSWEHFGDSNYTEVALSGVFQGQAAMSLGQLKVCDEKSDSVSATATVTYALRNASSGATSYNTYRGQEFKKGPGAGCAYFDLADYVAPPGQNLWAVRTDYSYQSFGKADTISHPQTYHTAWVYNAYLQGWCPTCKTGK